MFIYLNKKGQATLEYGIIIAVIVAGLIAMQVYVKRGFQGRLRQATDDIGDQFSPGYTSTENITTSTAGTDETITGGTDSITTVNTKQDQTRSTDEDVAEFTSEIWP